MCPAQCTATLKGPSTAYTYNMGIATMIWFNTYVNETVSSRNFSQKHLLKNSIPLPIWELASAFPCCSSRPGCSPLLEGMHSG